MKIEKNSIRIFAALLSGLILFLVGLVLFVYKFWSCWKKMKLKKKHVEQKLEKMQGKKVMVYIPASKKQINTKKLKRTKKDLPIQNYEFSNSKDQKIHAKADPSCEMNKLELEESRLSGSKFEEDSFGLPGLDVSSFNLGYDNSEPENTNNSQVSSPSLKNKIVISFTNYEGGLSSGLRGFDHGQTCRGLLSSRFTERGQKDE